MEYGEFQTSDTELLLNIIISLLNAKEINNEGMDCYEKFYSLFINDYLDFAKSEDTLANEAGAFLELQNISKELKKIVSLPLLFTKNLVSIAGPFSSGKSSFLNTCFKDKVVKLSCKNEPTTAIPTFIVNGNEPKIKGYRPDGKRCSIAPEIFNSLNHENIQKYNFDIRSIVPYITVDAPFNENFSDYQNICFIDTPGIGEENDDIVAEDAMKYSRYAMILNSLKDESGIGKSTIDFIKRYTENNDKKIFYVGTKADLLTEEERINALNYVKKVFEDNNITCEGFSLITVSPRKGLIEFNYSGLTSSIFDFLEKVNSDIIEVKNTYEILIKRIEAVFFDYLDAIEASIENRKEILKNIRQKQIEVEKLLNELDTYEDAPDLISELRGYFSTKILEKNKNDCEELLKKFKTSVYDIFKALGVNISRPVNYIYTKDIRNKLTGNMMNINNTNVEQKLINKRGLDNSHNQDNIDLYRKKLIDTIKKYSNNNM